MQLDQLFAKDIQRPIEGVIKADDAAHLSTEVDEYVRSTMPTELDKLARKRRFPILG